MEGVALHDQSWEEMADAELRLIAHQGLIALALAPMTAVMEGADLHDQCWEKMAGVVSLLLLASQCRAHPHHLVMAMEGGVLQKPLALLLVVVDAVTDGADLQHS